MKLPKPKTVKQLVKELDRWFSLFIRLRKADENGMVKCFTSGKIMHWKQSQAGHFASRRFYATRWDEINTQVQSVAENIFNQGNQHVFGKNIDIEYGEGTAEKLTIKCKNRMKLDAFTLGLLRDTYKTKAKKEAERIGVTI